MNTFEEYQAQAVRVPLSLRNNRDRIHFPVIGLQEEAGKIGALLKEAAISGHFSLTEEQKINFRIDWLTYFGTQPCFARKQASQCSRSQITALRNCLKGLSTLILNSDR